MIRVQEDSRLPNRMEKRQPYQPPRLVTLGGIQELTAFDVSVRVP